MSDTTTQDSDVNAPASYHCEKCSVTGEYNDECARCLMRLDEQENYDEYVKMGEL